MLLGVVYRAALVPDDDVQEEIKKCLDEIKAGFRRDQDLQPNA